MSALINKFLTDYILCLKERTRKEKKGLIIGFDWIIYNLGLSRDWIPVRLPFFRQPREEAAKTKTEAEFGIDLCFIAENNSELIIFVLKDEILNNQNWGTHNFDTDIRMAAAPDLSNMDLNTLKAVKVILTYNKDEDNNGIQLYDRLVQTMPGVLKEDIVLSFERWNISKIVKEVRESLFSSDLLPQHLTSLFSYICSQVSDFTFSTKEWDGQLIPNWKNFLRILFEEPLDERKLRLLPISLLILSENRKDVPDSHPGWIDLIEWAMLFIWDIYKKTENKKYKAIIIEIWHTLYIAELERYIVENSEVFVTEHGIHARKATFFRLTPINDAYVAFWHLGRMGILNLAPQQFINAESPDEMEMLNTWIIRSSQWLIGCLRNNPATMRPLIDLHHVELFLVWLTLWQAGRRDEIYAWLSNLETYLLARRSGQAHLPLIEARNRFDLVVEYAVSNQKPSEFAENSSYLLLMILELCHALEAEKRDELLNRYHKRIIRGHGDDNVKFTDLQIDLLGWSPPKDWADRILREAVYEGVGITTDNFTDNKGLSLSEQVNSYVVRSREKFPFEIPEDIPLAVYILACIKNRSPLPSEMWRELIFPVSKDNSGVAT